MSSARSESGIGAANGLDGLDGLDGMDAASADADVRVEVASLYVYPVKSCAGIAVSEAPLSETGFDLDRAWMLVDAAGVFVSQRSLPRMALVQPAFRHDELVLRAPGMLALHVALERVEAPLEATVWSDTVRAYDMGRLCAQWFSDFLGQPLRLVRFDPEAPRRADMRWTGGVEAATAFQDGFPLLVTSTASLAEVDRRLAEAGSEPASPLRFRPNIVLGGLDAHGEDHLDEIVLAGGDGPIRLKLVKPCPRCPIPDVDPTTGTPGHAVGDVLAAYRADSRLGGALTFGMNAIVLDGLERRLHVGAGGSARYAFADLD